MANEDKKKGVWIPEEVLELEELNGREMIVLSYYLAFTEKGKQKQCVKKIETVSEELHIPVSTLKRIRGKLREFGYLDTQFLFRGIGTKTNDIRSIKNGTSNRSTKNETPKRCRSTKNGTFRSTKNETPNGIKNGTSQYNEQYLMNNTNKPSIIIESKKGISTVTGETGMEIFGSSLYKLTLSNSDLEKFDKGSYGWLEMLCVKYALMKDKTQKDLQYLQYEIENGDIGESEKRKLLHQVESELPF